MGQTLNVAARWTSAGEGPRGSLEYNQANELILNKFIQYCEAFCGQFPEESKVVFKQALTWKTELKPADFTGLTQKGDEHVSDAASGDGQPLLSLRKNDRSYSISVRSFEMIDQVLKMAGEKKIAETRLCLEANPDPVPKMLGDRFATTKDEDMAMYRFAGEAIAGGQQQQRSGGEDGQEQQQAEQSSADNPSKETLLKMLISLKGLDDRTLQDVVIHCTSHVRLSPAAVDDTMKFWGSYCGNDERRYLLQSLHYHQDYTTVYSSGCRAPPWRCIAGDICYIIAIPHNEDPIYITASTQGYFVNGGENREDHTLNFEKEGEFYPELITLLQGKSSSFAEKATQQDFFKLHEQKRDGGMYESMAIEPYEDKSGAQETQRSQKKDEENKKKKEKKNKEQEKKKKLEPSLRWKNLQEVDDYDDTTEKRKKKQPRRKRDSQKIVTSDGEDSFEESSSESEEEEETPDRRNEANSDLPSEYWQIQKLVKYLKGGNQTATVIALCALRDFNLQQETCQLAIRDVGGLEVLINLLDTDAIKCKIGSLMILKEISRNTQIRRAIADLGGLQTMVKIMRDPNKELKCLAAETIANVAKFRRARRTVRQHGGIRKLVGLLDCAPLGSISSAEQEKDVEVARSGALALWSCSKSTRNKMAMRKAGAIPLLAKLLKSQHENMLIPVVGTLQECATEPSYRLAIRTEGMIEDLVKNLNSENQELQMHCASAIFKCAEEKETRDLVRQYGGLDPLVALLNNTDNKELLAAATGAIWKCAISPENVTRFQELKAIDLLVALLNKQPEEVLVNVVGALAELAQDPPNRLAIRKAGGIQPLVQLLTGTNQALLVNVTKAVGQCAEEPDNMVVIDKLDGVRLVWSLLKNPNPEVQASAAWAICPCIENAKDSGEMVRSFVGGLELIVSLLKSDDQEVLASVCAAVANIANDEENLAVITDHGVVPMLADLTETDDDRLRRHLAEAIARCCNWGNNRIEFGNKDAVAPLVDYLESPDTQVHRSTARALYQLSKDPENCITMHDAGVVKPLMKMVGAEDEILQEASAGCISNIRRLALANERARNKNH